MGIGCSNGAARGVMIHGQDHFVGSKDPLGHQVIFEDIDGQTGCGIIGHHIVQININDLTWIHHGLPAMDCKYFFNHVHSVALLNFFTR